ncbi:unnamed protein product [Cuscuta campestris]|uniref:Heat stress transcription factor n=1 Tax=Cuscuta campestris TaxID=132261 RepID=A0A484KLR2_9ASTE|nr:unnamed protein product [Cuscuta campestris]
MDGVQGSVSAAAVGNPPPPFLSKTYDMVEDPSTDAVVSWGKGNNSFIVWNAPEFAKLILPKYFKHSNFSSFVRQLNTYGFRKVDPDRWEFANEGFLRGCKHLLKSIIRRKPLHPTIPQPRQPSPLPPSPQVHQTDPVRSRVDGLEEEVGMLKRDKNILMQEFVKVRQQQQVMDHQLQNVGQKVHVMEQRQQQILSFLAKAMQTPGFVAQMVHQKSDGLLISGVNKKRRLPNQGEESFSVKPVAAALTDGQIVRFQPLMNEAAKALLRQILKINSSARLEPNFNHTSGFLTDNAANQISEVSLSEVLLATAPTSPYLTSEITQVPEMNTMPGFVDDMAPVISDGFSPDPEIDVLIDEMPKLPGINDVFWDQVLLASPLTGGTDETNSIILEGGAVEEDDDLTEEELEWDTVKRVNELTEQLELLASGSPNTA